jgi:hypothetical protein
MIDFLFMSLPLVCVIAFFVCFMFYVWENGKVVKNENRPNV